MGGWWKSWKFQLTLAALYFALAAWAWLTVIGRHSLDGWLSAAAYTLIGLGFLVAALLTRRGQRVRGGGPPGAG